MGALGLPFTKVPRQARAKEPRGTGVATQANRFKNIRPNGAMEELATRMGDGTS